MKILFAVILLSTTTSAQNTYGVQPAVKNNQIVLELSNISETESSNKLEISLTSNSQNLTFNQTEKMIDNITEGAETEATFSFNANYSFGNTEADMIVFILTDNKSLFLIKQFRLQYSLPTEHKLEQNYPNTFIATKIRYAVQQDV
jgi:hypothetical protein